MIRLLPVIFIFISINSFSQNYFIDFENGKDSLIRIDKTNPSNIWQIGKPQKIFFDSAYSISNTIVTDTINSYPINNSSSFTLKLIDSVLMTQFAYPDIIVNFKNKYNTDTLKDGGYVEVSLDGGNTWNNIINVSNFSQNLYSFNDTITGGIAALSGKSNWTSAYIGVCGFFIPPSSDSVFLKFIFSSDSIQTNKDGWMIDNIEIWYVADACGLVHEHSQRNSFVFLSPNPFVEKSILEFKNKNDEMTETEIYNCFGKKIYENKNILDNQIQLTRNNFSEGIYFYRIKTKSNYSESGKFVIQ